MTEPRYLSRFIPCHVCDKPATREVEAPDGSLTYTCDEHEPPNVIREDESPAMPDEWQVIWANEGEPITTLYVRRKEDGTWFAYSSDTDYVATFTGPNGLRAVTKLWEGFHP